MLMTNMLINSSIYDDYTVIGINTIKCFYSATEALDIRVYDNYSADYTLSHDNYANSNMLMSWFYDEMVG